MYALKQIIINNEVEQKDVKNEIDIFKEISKHDHPNIIKFKDYCIINLAPGTYN